jgi:hypothetical protein
MARRMRGYDDAQARQIFRDLIDMPANVAIAEAKSWYASTFGAITRHSSELSARVSHTQNLWCSLGSLLTTGAGNFWELNRPI